MTPPAFSLLHGFLGAPDFWNKTVDHLTAAFPAAFCDAVPLPGHTLYSGTELPRCFEDATKWYATRLGEYAPCWGIGYSMGARLTLGTAVQFPELFTGLILISVHPGIVEKSERQLRRQWEQSLISLAKNSSLAALVDHFEMLDIFNTQRSLPNPILKTQRHQRLTHQPENIIRSIEMLGLGNTPDLLPRLQQLSLPVLVITGILDKKYTAIARHLANQCDNISHVAIPQAGHNTILEAPDDTHLAIKQFITANLRMVAED